MHSKTREFSIIIPCYNHGQYLEECLISILQQTFDSWECIIINDGSTDNSEEIAKEFQKKDARFIFFSKPNEGLSATRNYGINQSQGKYILPLDSDDKIGKNYLKKAFEILESNPKAKLVYCKAELFGVRNEFWDLSKYSYPEILFNNCIFCSAVFKKSDYLNTQGYDLNMKYGYEDWEFWIQLLSKEDEVVQIDSVEFYYRQKEEESMIDFVKDENKFNQTLDYIFQKHESKYYELLGVSKDINGFYSLYNTKKNLEKVESTLNTIKKNLERTEATLQDTKINLERTEITLCNTTKSLEKIKSSFTYKTIYKIEREIRRLLRL